MGCDIHFFIEKYTDEPQKSGPIYEEEVKEENINELLGDERKKSWKSIDEWEWHKYPGESDYLSCKSELYSHRNYDVFSTLAYGVRGDGPSISEPRGLPDDVSCPVKTCSDQWGMDAHSHSYFTLSELIDAYERLKPELDKHYKDSYWGNPIDIIKEEIIDKMKLLGDNTDHIRCVFWFDN
jgi:hypothetical protein